MKAISPLSLGTATGHVVANVAALPAITSTAPGTPDYAIQNLSAGGFGFVTADEGNSVLAVIANLQARVAALEAALNG